MTTIDTLRAARELIARGWCQGAKACDILGRAVSPRSDDAVVFCAIGALVRAAGNDRREFYGSLMPLCEAIGLELETALETDIAHWNDERGRTQADVLAAFDRAIKITEKEQQA